MKAQQHSAEKSMKEMVAGKVRGRMYGLLILRI